LKIEIETCYQTNIYDLTTGRCLSWCAHFGRRKQLFSYKNRTKFANQLQELPKQRKRGTQSYLYYVTFADVDSRAGNSTNCQWRQDITINYHSRGEEEKAARWDCPKCVLPIPQPPSRHQCICRPSYFPLQLQKKQSRIIYLLVHFLFGNSL
jgi:hypothetical protein